MLADIEMAAPGAWMALALFFAIRPLSTLLVLGREPLSRADRACIAWFGVRGVGSLYYLTYALAHGAASQDGRLLADITLVVVAASIVLHGVSVTPILRRFQSADRASGRQPGRSGGRDRPR